MKRAHFRLIFILTVVLLMLVLVPVASAARPCIVAGAGTGAWHDEFIDETYSFRLHYNSVADGKLWVSVVDSNVPDRIGYFTASLNYCDAGDGFAMLSGVVVDSDIWLMGPGAPVRLFYPADDGTVLIMSQRTFAWVIDRGKITVQN